MTLFGIYAASPSAFATAALMFWGLPRQSVWRLRMASWRTNFPARGQPDTYAVGDVVAFFNLTFGKRLRVEPEDNANTMGPYVRTEHGRSSEAHTHLPFFYSERFELGYEAVGELDSRLETLADWRRPNEEGVVYYLKNDRVRGALLWNVWEQVEAARQLIAEAGPITAANLTGRLSLATVAARS